MMETMDGSKKKNPQVEPEWEEPVSLARGLKHPTVKEPLGPISPSIEYSCLLQDYTSWTLFRVNTQNTLKKQVIRDKT